MYKLTVLVAFRNSSIKDELSTAVVDLINCLESILISSKKLSTKFDKKYNTDIVIIDDHSMAEYSHLIPDSIVKQVKIINNAECLGQGNALNYGLETIESDYYAFTDSDCIVDVNWLTHIIDFFRLHPNKKCVVGPNWIHLKSTRKWQNIITHNESQLMRFIFESYVDNNNKASERIDCRNLAIRNSFIDDSYARSIFSNVTFGNSSQTSYDWRNSELDMISLVGYDENLIVNHKFILSLRSHVIKYFQRGKNGDFKTIYAEKYNTLLHAFVKYYFKRHFISPLFNYKVNFFYLWLIHFAFWFGIFLKRKPILNSNANRQSSAVNTKAFTIEEEV